MDKNPLVDGKVSIRNLGGKEAICLGMACAHSDGDVYGGFLSALASHPQFRHLKTLPLLTPLAPYLEK